MKLINILKQIIKENQGNHDYGCVMLYFKFPELFKLQDIINPEDIYEDPDDISYGLEKEPHITILYGLHDNVTLNDVNNVLDDSSFGGVSIKQASLFENEKFDVLKFDIGDSEPLEFYNKKLSELPNTNNFPNYHPHMTIGYIMKGKGQKYADIINKKYQSEELIYPSHIVFSEANGTQNKIKVNID